MMEFALLPIHEIVETTADPEGLTEDVTAGKPDGKEKDHCALLRPRDLVLLEQQMEGHDPKHYDVCDGT